MNYEDISDCIVTFEQVCKRLEEIENELAEQLGLPKDNIRESLIELNKQNKLIETELVASWLDELSSYNAELRYRAANPELYKDE